MLSKTPKQTNYLHRVLLAVFFICFFSIVVFSFEKIASATNVEIKKSHGVYQNGIYKDTQEVLVPSPFTVKKTEIIVKNNENTARRITISLEYTGTVEVAEPKAEKNVTSLVWKTEFSAFEEKSFEVFGKNLETSTPVLFSENVLQPTNTEITKNEKIALFNYVKNENRVQQFIKQEKLDRNMKTAIVIFAGLLLLLVVGSFVHVFGTEQIPKMSKKTRIHIENIYQHEDPNKFTKYNY